MASSLALPFQVPAVQFPLYTSAALIVISSSHTNYFHFTATMATPDAAPEDPRKIAAGISRSKEVPWYEASIGDKLTTGIRTLLEGYSGIAPKYVEDHAYKTVCILHKSCPSANI